MLCTHSAHCVHCRHGVHWAHCLHCTHRAHCAHRAHCTHCPHCARCAHCVHCAHCAHISRCAHCAHCSHGSHCTHCVHCQLYTLSTSRTRIARIAHISDAVRIVRIAHIVGIAHIAYIAHCTHCQHCVRRVHIAYAHCTHGKYFTHGANCLSHIATLQTSITHIVQLCVLGLCVFRTLYRLALHFADSLYRGWLRHHVQCASLHTRRAQTFHGCKSQCESKCLAEFVKASSWQRRVSPASANTESASYSMICVCFPNCILYIFCSRDDPEQKAIGFRHVCVAHGRALNIV
jgi:hypothetical protein